MNMSLNEFVWGLERLAVIANRADGGRGVALDWQKPEHSATVCQPILDAVRAAIGNDRVYDRWCSCFGEALDVEAALAEDNRRRNQ